MSFRYILIFLLLFVGIITTRSQNLDSLKHVYKNKNLKIQERLKALQQLSFEMRNTNPDKGVQLSKKLLGIIHGINFKLDNQFDNSNIINTKLKYEIKKIEWTGYNSLAANYMMLRKNDTALFYFNKILKAPKDTSIERLQDFVLGNAANIYVLKSDFKNALQYSFLSLRAAKNAKNLKLINTRFRQLAMIYTKMGNYSMAITYCFKSLAISEKTKDISSFAYVYSILGNIHYTILNNTRALEYFQKSLLYVKKTNNPYAEATLLMNIGNVINEERQYDKAMIYYMESIGLMKRSNLAAYTIPTTLSIASIYAKTEQPEKAIAYYDTAYQNSIKYESYGDQVEALTGIAKIYIEKKQYEMAKRSITNALIIAKMKNLLESQEKCYQILYNLHKIEHRSNEALEAYEKYIQIRDSLNNENIRKELTRKELSYEYEKKLTADSLKYIADKKIQEATILTQTTQLKNQTLQRYGLILIAVLLLCFAAFMYNRYKVINTQKQLIVVQKQQLETAKDQEKMVLEQKLLRSQMTPHFMFNTIETVQSYIYAGEKMKAMSYLSKFGKLTRQILDNSREEYVLLENELATLENYLSLQQLLFEEKLNYSITVDDVIDTNALMIPPMLAQPFIENALKHGIKHIEGKGQVEVKFYLRDNKLLFEVIDNGIGLEKSKEIKQLGHRSLATTITEERLVNINKNRKDKILITLVNVFNEYQEVSGVKLSFEIPYIYVV